MIHKTGVTLRCSECSNTSCKICKIGAYVPQDSLRGCIRIPKSDDIAAKYYHYKQELLPFLKTLPKVTECCDKIDSLESDIFDSDIDSIISPTGKIIPFSK